MRIRSIPLIIAAVCLTVWPSPVAVGQQTASPAADSLARDIQFLASDELKGRSVTDDTIDLARDHIRDRMRGIGLQLDAVDGSPFQTVSITVGSQVNEADDNFAAFEFSDREAIRANLDDGFGPLSIGRDRDSASGDVVFAGYGITSPDHNYDDYAGIDAEGKVVLMLRKEPGASDPDSPFDGVRNTSHAYFATKVANAIRHGAAAVLIINDPASARDAVQEEQNRIDQEQRRKLALGEQLAALPEAAVKNRAATMEKIAAVDRMIEAMRLDRDRARRGVLGISEAGTKTPQSDKLPVASIARDIANELLRSDGGAGLAELEQRIDDTYQPASRSLSGVTATVSVDLKPAVVETENVIGRLPGKGSLADETLVIGAHYDHVGMGGFGSLAPGTIAVHNGADDNASGTATMLACGERLKQRLAGVASHRTILFIAFTGEERGLLGSRHYVKHPALPIETTAAMINLDMVGRLKDNELTVYGTGSAAELEPLVDDCNREFQFDLFKVPSGYGPSDHQSFYRAGVPVLFFFTGLHNDYHRPSDDFDKIDFGNLTRVTDMVATVAFRLASLPQRPVYAETDQSVQIRRQMTAYLGVRVSGQRGVVRVTEVTDGGPASKAGLRPGDQIQRIGNSEVRAAGDVVSWVRNRSAGDAFEIQVLRNGDPVTIRGELEQRR